METPRHLWPAPPLRAEGRSPGEDCICHPQGWYGQAVTDVCKLPTQGRSLILVPGPSASGLRPGWVPSLRMSWEGLPASGVKLSATFPPAPAQAQIVHAGQACVVKEDNVSERVYTIREGDTLVLQCLLTGHPRPQVSIPQGKGRMVSLFRYTFHAPLCLLSAPLRPSSREGILIVNVPISQQGTLRLREGG